MRRIIHTVVGHKIIQFNIYIQRIDSMNGEDSIVGTFMHQSYADFITEMAIYYFSEPAYTAYMKGKTAYLQYVKNWDAAHPNIMKNSYTQSQITKYKVNNDMYYFSEPLFH